MANPAPVAEPSAGNPGRIRILHLEDNPIDADLVAEMLKTDQLDCEITLVSNRDAFVSALLSSGIDVIISDYSLPGYSGLEALLHTRNHGHDYPFIFVSGCIGDERAAEVVKLGATDYVMKDNLRRLGIAVRRAVEGAQSARLAREAEAQLLGEREFLADIFASVQDAIVVLDKQRHIVRTNPAAESLFGHHMPLIGKSPAVFAGDVTPGAADILGGITIRDGNPTQNTCLLKTVRGPGEFNIYAHPLVERRRGEQSGAILYLRDITREQALQQQLIQSQKMDCVGQLAGGVAHDFNNILQAIMGFSNLLASELPEGDTRHADAEEIYKMAERAAALTRQLLAFSRKQVLHYTDVDLNAVVVNMGKMLERLIGSKVRIQYALDARAPHVRADAGQIEQVVLNLVVNARDAMPAGGEIVIATRVQEISEAVAAARPALWRPGHFACIDVRDTGCGMPPEVMAHIFEPFFTTKEAGKGTGLGLSTVYGIVQQHGGWVDVTSDVGHGSTFAVFLPQHVAWKA